MLSSEDARRDAERFYPASRGRTVVVRFAVLPPEVDLRDPARVLGTYGLPARFLYLPNQFWKHKNHAVIVEALAWLGKADPSLRDLCALTSRQLDALGPDTGPRTKQEQLGLFGGRS